MNYKLVIPILIIVLLAFWFYKSKPEKESGIVEDWNEKVNSAKLDQELFDNASEEEKEELIYNFTQKIRQTDNYGKASFQNMPKALKAVYLVNEFEAELNNGGFLQFFTNSSGQYVGETIEILDAIGAKHNKDLIKKAIITLNKHNETPENLNKKVNSLDLNKSIESSSFYDNDELLEEMHQLDQEFYEYKEDISKMKMDYFEQHKNGLWSELKEKYGG